MIEVYNSWISMEQIFNKEQQEKAQFILNHPLHSMKQGIILRMPITS